MDKHEEDGRPSGLDAAQSQPLPPVSYCARRRRPRPDVATAKPSGPKNRVHRKPKDEVAYRHLSSHDRDVPREEERVRLLAGTRHPNETTTAMKACNDWLRMGRARSLTRLNDWYKENPAMALAAASMLTKWSSSYKWVTRGNIYDAEREAQLTLESQEVFSRGLALPYVRILELVRIYEALEPKLVTERTDAAGEVVLDKKGNPKTKVDLFVAKEMRDTLADLAEETGGRQKTIALLAKRDPLQDLFATLQRIKVPQIESGEGIIEANYTVADIPRTDEGNETGNPIADTEPAEGDRPGSGGGDLYRPEWDGGDTPEPDGPGVEGQEGG